ncbi:unnamed protein product [Darwinula stevensoni]|uniref:Glycerate kinase n=1 Tax=Darwinula stevensoni TaxID=69355 RepID=A0A7R9A3K4_9CRUS|nr:unnamed protein product [Darwinula stevensoni]CAG0891806.1 unnamed protein product [Darwinula stevensoni]
MHPARKEIIDRLRRDCLRIWHKGVEAVRPQNCILRHVQVQRDVLFVGGREFPLDRNCYIVGFGKAVLGMCDALMNLLGHHVQRGILSVPTGSVFPSRKPSPHTPLPSHPSIQVYEGAAENLPDRASLLAASRIQDFVQGLQASHVCLFLVSGGGSALLPSPKPPVTLEEKTETTRLLSAVGANIREVNTVRKKLSTVKGGRLGGMLRGEGVGFVLSDVVGGGMEAVASGPTVPDEDPPGRAMEVLRKYSLERRVAGSVLEAVGEMGTREGGGRVINVLVGSNRDALEACAKEAEGMGYRAFVLSETLVGEAREVGRGLARLGRFLLEGNGEEARRLGVEYGLDCEGVSRCSESRLALIVGGETTVTVRGDGVGGRNQEMALAFALECEGVEFCNGEMCFMSAGTDGVDGPKGGAAGAVAYPGQVEEARGEGMDPGGFLERNDSYSFYRVFSGGVDQVMTGHTGTNVMDVQVLLLHFA